MAARVLNKYAQTDDFLMGLYAVGEIARTEKELHRILAIDLLVRILSLIKSLLPTSRDLLRECLRDEVPSLSLTQDHQSLPPDAKPAEIRENVAAALEYASGHWVETYIVRSFLCEDRSRRCRTELLKQYFTRERNLDNWFLSFAEIARRERIFSKLESDQLLKRMTDIALALNENLRNNRSSLAVSNHTGVHIRRLFKILSPNQKDMTNSKLAQNAAHSLSNLLDEFLSINLTMIMDPDSYALLDVLSGWWNAISNPVKMEQHLSPIRQKIVTAITFRARMGQRSEDLVVCLRRTFRKPSDAKGVLTMIADQETPLSPEVDDWLRGIKRKEPRSSGVLKRALQGIESQETLSSIVVLYLDSVQTMGVINELDHDACKNHISRLNTGISALARQRNLEVSGHPGDVVEYNPAAHEMTDERVPVGHEVRIVKPMVLRRRLGGGRDVIVKAVVDEP